MTSKSYSSVVSSTLDGAEQRTKKDKAGRIANFALSPVALPSRVKSPAPIIKPISSHGNPDGLAYGVVSRKTQERGGSANSAALPIKKRQSKCERCGAESLGLIYCEECNEEVSS